MKKKADTSKLQCAVCGKQAARVVLMTKVFGRGETRVLIEDIPTIHCSNCSSQYLEAVTMDAVDEIRKNPAVHTSPQTIAAAKLVA